MLSPVFRAFCYNILMASTITNLDNIDVWKTKSNFNYDLWQENVTIKLVNVPWDKHTNVVRWEGWQDRRDFFNQQYGIVLKDNEYLGTINNLIGTERVRVNIPYKDLKYNYLAVYWNKDMPPLTTLNPEQGGASTDDSELFPQSEGHGDVALVDDRFYFIEDARQVSPSVSELTLSLDVWGTFSDRMAIDYAHYDRGHYMAKNISVDDFLSPKTKPRFKMEINTEPEPISITSTHNDAHEWHLSTGNYYFMIITDSPWYDNDNGRWLLNSDHWTKDGYYSENRSDWLKTTDASHLYNYVVSYSDIDYLMQYIYNLNLPIMKSIKMCAVLDGGMISTADYAVTLNGVEIKYITGCQTVNPIKIDTTKLVTNKWCDYYKAYEGQFLPIDLFNNSNFLGTFGLENFTNELTFTAVLSTLYPYIEASGWINGINGDGKTTVIAGSIAPQDFHYNSQVDIPTGDWQRTLIDLNIPLVMLRQEPTQQWNMEHKPSYDITTADAVNSRNNSLDANNVNLVNTTRSINNAKATSDNSANTGATNANASNDINYTNTTLGNNNSYTNSNLSNDTSYNNSKTSISNSHTNAYTTINAQAKNGTLSLKNQREQNAITKKWKKAEHDQQLSQLQSNYNFNFNGDNPQVKAEMENNTAHEITGNVVGTTLSVGGNLALTAATGGLTAPLAIANVAGAGITAGADAYETTSYNDTVYNLTKRRALHTHNNSVGTIDNSYNNYVGLVNELQNGSTDYEGWNSINESMQLTNLNANQKVADANQTASNSINDANHNTSKTIISNTKNTSDTIATNNHNTSASNIKRSLATSLAINEANRATSQANADDSKTLSDRITNNNYNRTLADIEIDRKNSYLENLVEYGVAGGDYHTPQTLGYGYQLVVRYPTTTNMRKIQNMFDEYGYTWNEDVNDIYASLMVDDDRKFNYWKLSDIKFSYMPTMERYRDSIRADLERGVRVWDAFKMTG